MITIEHSWQEIVDLAEHYIAIGQVEHWLHDREDSQGRPWHLVTSCVASGSLITEHGEVVESVRFMAPHPSGLTFTWSVNLGPYGMGGRLNSERIESIARLTTGTARDQFVALARRRAEVIRNGASKRLAEVRSVIDHAEAILAMLS